MPVAGPSASTWLPAAALTLGIGAVLLSGSPTAAAETAASSDAGRAAATASGEPTPPQTHSPVPGADAASSDTRPVGHRQAPPVRSGRPDSARPSTPPRDVPTDAARHLTAESQTGAPPVRSGRPDRARPSIPLRDVVADADRHIGYTPFDRPTASPSQARVSATGEVTGNLTAESQTGAPPVRAGRPDSARPSTPLRDVVADAVRYIRYTLFNRAPTASPSQARVSAAGVVTGNLNAESQTGAPLTYTVTRAPTAGTVNLTDTGGYTYTPDVALAAAGGTDSFTVTVDNGAALRLPGLLGVIQTLLHRGAQLIGLSGPDTTEARVPVRLSPADVLVGPPVGGESPPGSGSIQVLVGDGPIGLAVSPDGGRLYVAVNGADSVAVIDTATGRPTATIAVGVGPVDVVGSPDGARVYVTNKGDGTVSVIDTATHTVIGTAAVGGVPSGIAVAADGSSVYVSTNAGDDGFVVVLDADGGISTGIRVGANPAGIAVDPNGGRIFVAQAGGVSVVDINLRVVTAVVDVPGRPYSVALVRGGTVLYVAGNDVNGVLAIIDAVNGTLVDTRGLGGGTSALVQSPDGRVLYTTRSLLNIVAQIDVDGDDDRTIAVGSSPTRVAVSPDGSHLYVSYYGSDTVALLDLNEISNA